MIYDPRRYWTERPMVQGPSYVGPGGKARETDVQGEVFDAYVRNYMHDSYIPSILDFGCGSGRFANLLGQYTERYVGVDISPTGILLARQRCPEHQFVWIKDDSLPFPQSSFHMSAIITVLQHIPNENWIHWSRQLRRVLITGGKVLIIDTEDPEQKADHVFPRSPFRVARALNRRVESLQHIPTGHYIALIG